MKLKSLIRYIGGKHHIADWVCSFFDYSVECYLELFGGSGSVLFAKKPHKVEIFNDIDDNIINFFLILREQGDKLISELEALPYARKIYNKWEKLDFNDLSDFERAVRWFYVARSSFIGKIGKGWGYSFSSNMAKSYHSAIDLLGKIRERIKSVMFECRDYKDILGAITKDKEKDILIYADPPYFATEFYYKEYKFTKEDHIKLAEMLNRLDSKIVISYYPHDEIYELYPAQKWNYFYRNVTKHSYKSEGEEKPRATEMIITNYTTQGVIF